MKITIIVENDKKIPLYLNDEMMDNDNFVDLVVDNKEYSVSVDDLFYAIKAFYDKRNGRLEKEMLNNPTNIKI